MSDDSATLLPMKRSLRLFALVCVLTIGFYFPLFLGKGLEIEKRLLETPSNVAVHKQGICYLTLSIASIMVPVLMDHSYDILFARNYNVEVIERMMLLLSIFMISAGQFVSLHTSIATVFYIISIVSHTWILTGFALIVLNRLSTKSFTSTQVAIVLTAFYLYSISEVVYLFAPTERVILVSKIAKVLAFILIFLQIAYHHIQLFFDWRSTKSTFLSWVKAADLNAQTSIFISLLFSCAFVLFVTLRNVFHANSNIKFFSMPFVYAYLCIIAVTSLLITLMPHRFAKTQAMEMFSELEMKKTFVRYISHELRTPLSIIMAGLLLVEDQLRDGVELKEAILSIQELRLPCETGVGILDELLNYEKLSAGIAYLEKSAVDPSLFVEHCIVPFKLASRQKHIQLNVHNNIRRGQFLVDIDEAKVRQPPTLL